MLLVRFGARILCYHALKEHFLYTITRRGVGTTIGPTCEMNFDRPMDNGNGEKEDQNGKLEEKEHPSPLVIPRFNLQVRFQRKGGAAFN